MTTTKLLYALTCLLVSTSGLAQRYETRLTTWRFHRGELKDMAADIKNDNLWKEVSVPHDWAIEGPFNMNYDRQNVAIVQNGETEASDKTGRTGALPWIGAGWYKTSFTSDKKDNRRYILKFDGAMAEPEVYVNGQKAGEWKYGYTPFNLDITPYVKGQGQANEIAVRLNNVAESSRWYPGAGLYRPVTLVETGKVCIDEWGLNVETKAIDTLHASCTLLIGANIEGATDRDDISCTYRILDRNKVIDTQTLEQTPGGRFAKEIQLSGIRFWSPEQPACYTLEVTLRSQGKEVETRRERFGIRTVSIDCEKGFALNGHPRKIKGVCLHHDLGMLGAAINKAALARQIRLLKEMGCDAIRTSHNHPSQWQMELCDSMGMMVMAESLDMWRYPKVKNGYNRFYAQWWQRDLTNLVMSNRMHPSIVMWSIGNEIPEQGSKDGARMTRQMQDLIHSLDTTRPVTAGMDRIDNAIATGYAQVLDVPGINYRLPRYENAYQKLKHGYILGSETASTVSSRGVYKFPVTPGKMCQYDDGQSSGYDVEACSWSNLPDEDWIRQDSLPWVIGEFVWTGFDYLGEPTPYDGNGKSRSSYFGIIDLAGIPKDRYYLYRSHWNKDQATVHLLPHWTWPGREGQTTPVYCYTNYPTAELFVNGKSQGRISKNEHTTQRDIDAQHTELLDHYRLRWSDVVYEPGELKVVVYDKEGRKRGQQTVRTAGKPHHLELSVDRKKLNADGEDMAFVTVSIVDEKGNLCPDADNRIDIEVDGAGLFKGICNGDATSHEVFTQPAMKAFHGMLAAGVISKKTTGAITFRAHSNGLTGKTLKIKVGKTK